MEGKENQAYQPEGELHNFQGEDVPSSITKKVARKGDIFSRAVGAFWASLGRFYKRHKKLLERLTLVLLNVCLLVYFAVAISHHVKQGNEDIGWCNGLGILIILLFFLYMWMFYYLIVKKYFGRILYEHIVAPIVRVWDKAWERTLFRVAISLLVLAALVVFLVLDTVGSRERLVSFFGLIVILLFGFIFSRHPT
ncbi:unnamed protein product, partial [Timema podura]|nr:unnamed protein product [Timema podura]